MTNKSGAESALESQAVTEEHVSLYVLGEEKKAEINVQSIKNCVNSDNPTPYGRDIV